MRYAYPCNIVRDEEEARETGREAYGVTFPTCLRRLPTDGRGK